MGAWLARDSDLPAKKYFKGIERIKSDSVALAGVVFGLGLAGTGVAFILYYFIVHWRGALAA